MTSVLLGLKEKWQRFKSGLRTLSEDSRRRNPTDVVTKENSEPKREVDMGGQAESITPSKSKTAKPGATGTSSFQGLRKHLSGNEVHFHDDQKNLKFVWPDSLNFRTKWKEFVATVGRMESGDRCAFIGDISRVKNDKQKCGVLIFEKTHAGDVELQMEEYDPDMVYEFEIRKNEIIEDIDRWIQENC